MVMSTTGFCLSANALEAVIGCTNLRSCPVEAFSRPDATIFRHGQSASLACHQVNG